MKNLKKRKLEISKNQQDKLLDALTKDLCFYRTRARLTQQEISNIIGVSRQNFLAVEKGSRKMSWCMYMSLICLLEHHAETQQILRQSEAYPAELFARFGESKRKSSNYDDTLTSIPEEVKNALDEQALHAIRRVILEEYFRVAKASGDNMIIAVEWYRSFFAE